MPCIRPFTAYKPDDSQRTKCVVVKTGNGLCLFSTKYVIRMAIPHGDAAWCSHPVGNAELAQCSTGCPPRKVNKVVYIVFNNLLPYVSKYNIIRLVFCGYIRNV